MKDGHLYCEVCGEEIKIVPDFEPEIEYSIQETLSGIVDDVRREVPDKREETEIVEIKSNTSGNEVVLSFTDYCRTPSKGKCKST